MDEHQMFNFTSNSNASEMNLVIHSLWEVVIISTVSAIMSLITITGNVLVMLSFKVNSQLKTVTNYYLLSLAFADLIIGVLSMNLYTSYILMGYWALGDIACDLWLALDYVASNASVMNLLVISFDRYFSITRPLTYRAKRTPKRAGIMIGLAWLISLLLWAPPILCWQYIVGRRTVPDRQCQIQFFSEPVITFGTAIAAFYIPVSVMTILYCKIYKETERRTKDLAELQGINLSIDSDNKTSTRTAITRSCLSTTSAEQNQERWLSSSYSNTMNLTTMYNKRFSNRLQHTTFSNYVSTEEHFIAPTVLLDSDQICTSESKSRNCKATGSSFSSCESMDMPFTKLSSNPSDSTLKIQMTKRKRRVLIKEKKAAQTLSAILLAFILTWTPYNIMVLIATFCSHCIPLSLWQLGYWLCYVNSTVNPMCYALCNKTFKKTFRMLLFCQCKKKVEKPNWHGQFIVRIGNTPT